MKSVGMKGILLSEEAGSMCNRRGYLDHWSTFLHPTGKRLTDLPELWDLKVTRITNEINFYFQNTIY